MKETWTGTERSYRRGMANVLLCPVECCRILTSEHETSTFTTKVVRHCVTSRDGLGHGKCLDLVFAANILKRLVENGEVRGKHGGCELAAVDAVAHKLVKRRVSEVWQWELVRLTYSADQIVSIDGL